MAFFMGGEIMSDYFEKLGNLLNEALEKGEIPVSNNKDESVKTESETNTASNENTQQEQQKTFTFKTNFFKRKRTVATAQIIKNNDYNYIPQLSPELQSAFNLLGLNYPCTWKEVNKKYHSLLKQTHPDTKKSEQQITTQINDLQNAYQLLKKFYGK